MPVEVNEHMHEAYCSYILCFRTPRQCASHVKYHPTTDALLRWGKEEEVGGTRLEIRSEPGDMLQYCSELSESETIGGEGR